MTEITEQYGTSTRRASVLSWAFPLAIIIAGAAAYASSLDGVLLLDDFAVIPGLKQRLSLGLFWPNYLQRWLLYLTFVLNLKISGDSLPAFHLVNIAIHSAAGIVLYGIIRRALRLPHFRHKFDAVAEWLAFATALIWMVHPLQTQSVTYICQRGESMAGLFYLLTMYCAIRSFDSSSINWQWLAAAACLCGNLTKQIMVSAPAMVLLFDILFVSKSLRVALYSRPRLYLGLGLNFIFLVMISMSHVTGSPSAGFNAETATPLEYLFSQPLVILMYLRKTFLPYGLLLIYEGQNESRGILLLAAAGVGAGLLAVLWGLFKKKAWAFLGAWFFGILAITSSFMPLADHYFEHRMYLPIAAPILAVVMCGYFLLKRLNFKLLHGAIAVGMIVLILAAVTFQRNRDYAEPVRMWRSVLAHSPKSGRAVYYLVAALVEKGRREEALTVIHDVLARAPLTAESHERIGFAYNKLEMPREEEQQYLAALRINPNLASVHCYYANFLHDQGRHSEAVNEYAECMRLSPIMNWPYYGAADSLTMLGQWEAAIPLYEKYISGAKDNPDAYNGLAAAYNQMGRLEEAERHFLEALRLLPTFAEAHANYGALLTKTGRPDEAERHLLIALKLRPDMPGARLALGRALEANGKLVEAAEQYRLELKRDPQMPEAKKAYERVTQVR